MLANQLLASSLRSDFLPRLLLVSSYHPSFIPKIVRSWYQLQLWEKILNKWRIPKKPIALVFQHLYLDRGLGKRRGWQLLAQSTSCAYRYTLRRRELRLQIRRKKDFLTEIEVSGNVLASTGFKILSNSGNVYGLINAELLRKLAFHAKSWDSGLVKRSSKRINHWKCREWSKSLAKRLTVEI